MAPERVRNVPKMVMKKVMQMSVTFHTFEGGRGAPGS